MSRIIVVDNGGQWTHREWRVLKEMGVETEIIKNNTPVNSIKADGIVLSGGTANFSYDERMLGSVSEYLDQLSIPILGICVGHQFMSIHLGGEVKRAIKPEFGKVIIELKSDSELFKNIPKKFVAWASHNDEVTSLPPSFRLTASSDNCLVEAMEDGSKSLYGVQFHPEVEHTEYGRKIFSNFVDICKK